MFEFDRVRAQRIRAPAHEAFDGTPGALPTGAIGAEILRLDRVICELSTEVMEHVNVITPVLSDVGVGGTGSPALMLAPREAATCQLEARLRECADRVAHLTNVVRELSARVRL